MSNLALTADLFSLFAEPARVRLAALLARHELTVAEIVAVTDMAQSRVSTHLGKLREAGVLRDRRDGPHTYYSMQRETMPKAAERVWKLIEDGVKDSVLESDLSRCEQLLAARAQDKKFPDAFAGEMERHYSPGRTWEATARAFAAMMRPGDVLDIGAGDGTIAQMLAPRARSYSCVDRSESMIAAAKKRLGKHRNVRFHVADAHRLPHEKAAFDTVLLLNVLAHTDSPAKVFTEVARVLRPGGDVVAVTIAAHDHEGLATSYGHAHAGFSCAELRRFCKGAGLSVVFCDITSRERQAPHLEVVTLLAQKERAS